MQKEIVVMTTAEYHAKTPREKKNGHEGKVTNIQSTQKAARNAYVTKDYSLLPNVVNITKSGWYYLLHVEVESQGPKKKMTIGITEPIKFNDKIA